jgi:hypothetical protein
VTLHGGDALLSKAQFPPHYQIVGHIKQKSEVITAKVYAIFFSHFSFVIFRLLEADEKRPELGVFFVYFEQDEK